MKGNIGRYRIVRIIRKIMRKRKILFPVQYRNLFYTVDAQLKVKMID